MSKFLGNINAFNFANQYFSILGNGYAGNSGYCVSLLTDDFGVESAVNKDCFSDLFGFGIIKEITASCRKFLFNRRIDIFMNNNGLFGSSYHTVIKCF